MNWKHAALGVMLGVVGIGVLAEYQRAAQPALREPSANPIYTIGDRGLGANLSAGKRPVKLGPMFYGLYPGGFAFRTPEEARAYLAEKKLDSAKWRVYELAGDFAADAVTRGRRTHIAHSLPVVREVRDEL
jgi:hypothetical protein